MSLIFRALQRFGSPEVEQGKNPEASAPKGNAFTLRRVLLSAPVALGAAAAIFVVGLIVSQGINFFPSRVTSMSPAAAQAASPGQEALPDALSDEALAMERQSGVVVSDARPADATEQISYHVYPPEQETTLAADASAAPDKIQFRYLESADTGKEDGLSSQRKALPPVRTAVLDTNHNVAGTSSSSTEHAGAPLRTGDEQKTRELSLVRYNTVSPAIATASEPGVAKPSLFAPSHQSESTGPNLIHQRQAAQATMHLRVSQLAQRISSAIQADDVQLTSMLLAKLVKMKGADNAFVVKLKAYSLIRQNRLDEARTILSDVLAHNAKDLEAGLNMAVIDMKTGRLEDARRRLVQLQELYPENNHIVMYLRQLPR